MQIPQLKDFCSRGSIGICIIPEKVIYFFFLGAGNLSIFIKCACDGEKGLTPQTCEFSSKYVVPSIIL
jgi:hypothetical protein